MGFSWNARSSQARNSWIVVTKPLSHIRLSVLALFLSCLGSATVVAHGEQASGPEAPKALHRSLATRELVLPFSIQRAGRAASQPVHLALNLPPRQSAYHALLSSRLPEGVAWRLEQTEEASVAHGTVIDLKPYEKRDLAIRLSMGFSAVPVPQELTNEAAYLQQEPYVETHAPPIRQRARILSEATGYATAASIFHWVGNAIQYTGYRGTVRGALWALENRQGDCTEFACLFAALCRANGIPARVMSGYLCMGCTVLKSSTYHNWAEFYWNGAWHVADPLKGVFDDNGDRYVAFSICSAHLNSGVSPFARHALTGADGDIAITWH